MALAHLRCYLRRPFRHRWKYISEYGDDYLRCTACGKRARVGSFRPGGASISSTGHTHADWGGDGGGD